MQLRVKDKLFSFNLSPPICRSALVMQLRNELHDLRIELDNKKIGWLYPHNIFNENF